MNIRLEDFNNIDLKNAGSLPIAVKLVLLGILALMLLGRLFHSMASSD